MVGEAEDRIGRLEAAEAMRNLMSRYCQAVDSGSRAVLAEVFAPDAVLHRDVAVEGRTAILDFFQTFFDLDTTLSRHHITNLEVSVESAKRARCRCYYVAAIGVDDRSYLSFGNYDDLGERRGDGWVLVEKSVINVTATTHDVGWGRPATPGAPWRHQRAG